MPSRSSTCRTLLLFFFFNDTATTEIYTLSLHDALPIFTRSPIGQRFRTGWAALPATRRSEEHTSELQSQSNLVCRLLLEKKKSKQNGGIVGRDEAPVRGIDPYVICE